jgi:Coenzyme PQQ synthesis protein D (PqqD)
MSGDLSRPVDWQGKWTVAQCDPSLQVMTGDDSRSMFACHLFRYVARWRLMSSSQEECMAMSGQADARVFRLRQGSVTWRDLGGEVIALDLSRSVYLGLNAAGRVLWARLVGGATEDELAESLVDAFGIDAGQAAADVTSFLEDAGRRGLLEE